MSRNEDSELDIKRLNEAVLRPGDLVLTTTVAVSAAIRAATRSDISHAMVYVEDRSVIDATDDFRCYWLISCCTQGVPASKLYRASEGGGGGAGKD